MEQLAQDVKEKRKYPRFPVSFRVLYKVRIPFQLRVAIGDNDCPAVAHDIGEGGMALVTNFKIPEDSLLRLKFTITNDSTLSRDDRMHNFELDADVRYCGWLTEKTSYRLGVSFMNILPSEQAYIGNYIRINSLTRNSSL